MGGSSGRSRGRAGGKSGKPAKAYCTFYNKLGACRKGRACTFIHDANKIAICLKFLRGACDGKKESTAKGATGARGAGGGEEREYQAREGGRKREDVCLLSHELCKDKMPLCEFFLRGVCTTEDCPYVHVRHPEGTPRCAEFSKGYCPNGAACEELHRLFDKHGGGAGD